MYHNNSEMFHGVRNKNFLPVFQSFGSSPLAIWEKKVENGRIRRISDEEVRALTLEISSCNVTTCYITCPKNRKTVLGINMHFLVMIVKNLKKYFSFEVTILDDTNVKRRFRLSNFQRVPNVQHFSTTIPLCLDPGWNELYFNLWDLTRKMYGTNYVETSRIKVNANCRLRIIYFCDKIYSDKEIPLKFKLFLPIDHPKNPLEENKIKRASQASAALTAKSKISGDLAVPEDKKKLDPENPSLKSESESAKEPKTLDVDLAVVLEETNLEDEKIVDMKQPEFHDVVENASAHESIPQEEEEEDKAEAEAAEVDVDVDI